MVRARKANLDKPTRHEKWKDLGSGLMPSCPLPNVTMRQRWRHARDQAGARAFLTFSSIALLTAWGCAGRRRLTVAAISCESRIRTKINPARLYYTDCESTCLDCGNRGIWRADAQKWWYEEAGSALESKVIRCRECGICHKHEREDRRRQNEENRKKHLERTKRATGDKKGLER